MGKSWQWFILAYATALRMLLIAKGIQNWIPLVFQVPQLKEGLVKHSQALFLANRTPAVPFSTPKHTKKNPYRPHLPTLHRGTTASTWQDSSSALHFAASGGFQDVVETLLEAASK